MNEYEWNWMDTNGLIAACPKQDFNYTNTTSSMLTFPERLSHSQICKYQEIDAAIGKMSRFCFRVYQKSCMFESQLPRQVCTFDSHLRPASLDFRTARFARPAFACSCTQVLRIKQIDTSPIFRKLFKPRTELSTGAMWPTVFRWRAIARWSAKTQPRNPEICPCSCLKKSTFAPRKELVDSMYRVRPAHRQAASFQENFFVGIWFIFWYLGLNIPLNVLSSSKMSQT